MMLQGNERNRSDFISIGDILHVLDDDLKKAVRDLEKFQKKLINSKYGLIFNETYIYI